MAQQKKHLSYLGVGPVYGVLAAALTVGSLMAEHAGWLQSGDVPAADVPMTLLGFALVASALALYLSANIQSKVFRNIKNNNLVTTGVYAWVRNPIYSAIMLACTGVLLMAHNLWLLVLPLVLWGLMALLVIPTEEKWLRALYGKSYEAYCARVNRCIPWPPMTHNG